MIDTHNACRDLSIADNETVCKHREGQLIDDAAETDIF